MKLRVMVLEDEWVARNYLVELIEESQVGTVVGAVASTEDAHAFLASAKGIDVVFVDVNLMGSESSGLDFIKAYTGAPEAPAFVLATAMREHALLAFELGAKDYLTKPFSKGRVAQCLVRIAANKGASGGASAPRSSSTASATVISAPSRIVARKRKSLVFLDVDDLWAFESADRLAIVHSAHGTFDIDLSLASVEASFGKQFLRVHRNWLVNTRHIRELERDSGETTLRVGTGYEDGTTSLVVPVARERAQDVRELLTTTAPGVRKR
jgi:two-component system, LytTR family, response regulator LytT